jgi:drug/metabolite transporter (DMT)-like permease
MIQSWFLLAITASLCWGTCYAITEIALKHYTPAFILATQGVICSTLFIIITFLSGDIHKNISEVKNLNTVWCLLIPAVAIAIGNLAITHAIGQKNATLASIIEISYPIFTALFAFLLTRQMQLNFAAALGAVMIASGAFVILRYGS